jgi:hypothetical protein
MQRFPRFFRPFQKAKAMKKLLLLSAAFALWLPSADAQWINGITYLPPNPTANDSVVFYVSLSFPSGSCDEHTQFHTINGQNVDAYALHCLGMLTVICPYTDTFAVGKLPAGSYWFRFHVDIGGLPSPCTPGINPGPADSIPFLVSPVTALPLHAFPGAPSARYDPVRALLLFESTAADFIAFELFSADGRRVLHSAAHPPERPVLLDQWPDGLYVLRYRAGPGPFQSLKLALRR